MIYVENELIGSGAVFSDCREYRYCLWRKWDESKKKIMFIGLNPSTADEVNNDPTVQRCINYSKKWGYGEFYMMNIFAYRTTYPTVLLEHPEPVGKENDSWLKKIYKKTDMCIGAWGNHGEFLDRSKQVLSLLPKIHCLKVNQSGEPAHPLYLKGSIKPFLYNK